MQQKIPYIAIPRQNCATREVVFQLDRSFFRRFENSLVEEGALDAFIKLDKNVQHMQLSFTIRGEIVLVCDRSLELFNYPIFIEQLVHFISGKENKELDVDYYMIHQQATTIDLSQHIYDFVTLAVPMKKLHPRFITTGGV